MSSADTVDPAPTARAVLDADIIYSRVLYELMGRTAIRPRLLDPFWSDELLAEAKRSLVNKKGLTDDVAQRWVDYMSQNFPDGRIDLDEAPATADLASLTTDPADEHVCALAVAANADYLFTHDRGYLREGLGHGGAVTARAEAHASVATTIRQPAPRSMRNGWHGNAVINQRGQRAL